MFLNIFISIIEEGYVISKIKNKTSFIYKYLKIDSKLVNPKIKSKKSLLVTENFFKEKAEEDMLNEMRLDTSNNDECNRYTKPISYVKCLEEEQNNSLEYNSNLKYNIDDSKNLHKRNDNYSNIPKVNKINSYNNLITGKNIENKNKEILEKANTNQSQPSNNFDIFMNIQNPNYNESLKDKEVVDNFVSNCDKDLEDDLFVVDEDTYNEKFKSVMKFKSDQF